MKNEREEAASRSTDSGRRKEKKEDEDEGGDGARRSENNNGVLGEWKKKRTGAPETDLLPPIGAAGRKKLSLRALGKGMKTQRSEKHMTSPPTTPNSIRSRESKNSSSAFRRRLPKGKICKMHREEKAAKRHGRRMKGRNLVAPAPTRRKRASPPCMKKKKKSWGGKTKNSWAPEGKESVDTRKKNFEERSIGENRMLKKYIA